MVDCYMSFADARLRAAIDAVYRHFSMTAPSAIEGCPCCVGTRNVDVLLTTPLRDITGEALWHYVSGVYYTIGSDRDFRYLLPRILEISVSNPGNANNPEIVLNKLGLARWRSWTPDEQRAVTELLDAWFERALARDLSEADDGWVGRGNRKCHLRSRSRRVPARSLAGCFDRTICKTGLGRFAEQISQRAISVLGAVTWWP
jgi:hypothetical protein